MGTRRVRRNKSRKHLVKKSRKNRRQSGRGVNPFAMQTWAAKTALKNPKAALFAMANTPNPLAPVARVIQTGLKTTDKVQRQVQQLQGQMQGAVDKAKQLQGQAQQLQGQAQAAVGQVQGAVGQLNAAVPSGGRKKTKKQKRRSPRRGGNR